MLLSRIHKLAIVAAFTLGTMAHGAVTAPVAPWDRGDLYRLTSTNKPPKPTGAVVESREALDELMAEAPTSLASVVLGAAQALYGIAQPTSTNLPADLAAIEQERHFRDMLRDVDRMTKEGRAEEAIAYLKQQLNQPMPPVQRGKINNRIASFFFRQQRYQEALPYMREAVRLNSQDYATLCNLAAVLMSMGDLKEADFLLRTLDVTKVQEQKLLFSIFFNRACVSSLQNNLKEAMDSLRKAAQTDPHSTLASLGDPQLDSTRPALEFFDLKSRLETIIAPTAPLVDEGPGVVAPSPQ